MKRAITIGMGLAIDLSGNAVFFGPPLPPDLQLIGQDFRQVGDYLQTAIQTEGPKIEAEIAQQNARQLRLQLGAA
jgi:hypothetical protein